MCVCGGGGAVLAQSGIGTRECWHEGWPIQSTVAVGVKDCWHERVVVPDTSCGKWRMLWQSISISYPEQNNQVSNKGRGWV